MTNERIGNAYRITTSNTVSPSQQDPSNPSKVNESGLGPGSERTRGRDIGSALMVNYKYGDRYIVSGECVTKETPVLTSTTGLHGSQASPWPGGSPAKSS